MTGLSKAGVCKNASGHFYLSMSICCIFCSEFMCAFLLYSWFLLPVIGENVMTAIKKKWHPYICPMLFLVPATEIEDKCAIYKTRFHSFLLSEAGRMQAQLKSRWGPVFFSFF